MTSLSASRLSSCLLGNVQKGNWVCDKDLNHRDGCRPAGVDPGKEKQMGLLPFYWCCDTQVTGGLFLLWFTASTSELHKCRNCHVYPRTQHRADTAKKHWLWNDCTMMKSSLKVIVQEPLWTDTKCEICFWRPISKYIVTHFISKSGTIM